MSGTLPWSTAPSPLPANDPNELLRRIDQNTAEIVRWVKYGFIATIILLLLIAVGV